MNPLIKGYLGALVAVLFFGTYAVPIKKFKTGDGIVFQWVECCGILLVGIVVHLINGAPYIFEPLGLLGGMFWCLGNATVVPIIDNIGLGLGLLIWGGFNMVIGWSVGHFGILVEADHVHRPVLNYLGVALALISVFLYFPIKPSTTEEPTSSTTEEHSLINGYHDDMEVVKPQPKSEMRKKITGIVLSVIAGFLYASNVIPISILQGKKEYKGNPHYLLAFTLSHFLGIFATSTVLLAVYAIYKRNKPDVYPQSLLPGLASGLMWGVAQAGMFVANYNLGLSISFPIICTGPGVIGSLWGVLVFKEVRGFRNLAWLCGAFAVTVTGILLITFSKQ